MENEQDFELLEQAVVYYDKWAKQYSIKLPRNFVNHFGIEDKDIIRFKVPLGEAEKTFEIAKNENKEASKTKKD